MTKNRLSNRLLIDEQPQVNIIYWLTWLLLLIVTFGSLIIYGRYIIEQSISRANEAQKLSQAQLEHLKNRLDKAQFGSLTVDDITTSYLNIDSAEGKAQFLKDLGLGNLIEAAQNPGLIGNLPANFFSLIGNCPGCVMLQPQSPGLPQLGHLSVAGIGSFGGLVSGAGVTALGNIVSGGSVTAATFSGNTVNTATLGVSANALIGGNTLVGGNVGIGTTNPLTQLDVAGRIPTSQTGEASTSSNPLTVFVRGQYAYVVSNSLQIFNISNPATPVLTGSVGAFSVSAGIHVEGRYAYVTAYGSSLFAIYDISNPAAPAWTGGYGLTSAGPASLTVQGRYAYVAASDGNKVEIFDVGDPTLAGVPKVSTINVLSKPSSVKVVGQYLYIANFSAGELLIYNIANPANPVLTGTIGGIFGPAGIWVEGRFAYVTNYNADKLEIFDISNPANPIRKGSAATGPNPVSVTVQGRYAFVGSFYGHAITVHDISNPDAPITLGYHDLGAGNEVSWLTVQGRYMYATTFSTNKLRVYDIGGAYIQQLEAGGVTTTSLSVSTNLAVANSLDVGGALSAGSGANITGNSSLYGDSYVSGRLGLGNLSPMAKLHIESEGPAAVGAIIAGASGQTADLLQAQDSTGTILARIDATGNLTVQNAVISGTLTVNGHIITGGSVPTIVAQAAAGVGATVSISGNDTLGTITITTGAAPVAGDLASITFVAAFGTAPKVILTPANASGSTIQYFQGLVTTNTFRMASGSAPAPSTTYVFNYWVGQ